MNKNLRNLGFGIILILGLTSSNVMAQEVHCECRLLPTDSFIPNYKKMNLVFENKKSKNISYVKSSSILCPDGEREVCEVIKKEEEKNPPDLEDIVEMPEKPTRKRV